MWTITNTPMLWGGLAVAAVVGLHLWRRRKPVRSVVFAGAALLGRIESKRNSERWLRERVVLSLRVLAVLMIVAAFAGLVWHGEPGEPSATLAVRQTDVTEVTQGDRASGAGVRVVVLDASASMGRVVDGVDWFDSAKELARRAVAKAGDREAVRVVVAGGRWRGDEAGRAAGTRARPRAGSVWELGEHGPLAVEGGVRATREALMAAIDRIEAGRGESHATEAMSIAARLASEDGRPGRIEVVSDFQATEWSAISARADVAAAGARASVAWMPVGGERDGANVGIGAISILSGLPTAGTRGDIIVAAENRSGVARQVELTLSVDGREIARQRIASEAWDRGEAMFSLNWGAPGTKRLQCTMTDTNGDDALAADNHAEWEIDVRDRPRVVIVSDESREPGAGDYFWRRALEAGDRMSVDLKWSRELGAGVFSHADAVVIGHVESLGPLANTALAEVVKRGGGVIWLAGDESAAARWHGFEDAVGASSEVVPPAWRWGAMDAAEGNARQIRSTQGESITAWSGVSAYRRWTFDRTAATPEHAPVQLEYGDHQPLAWAWRPWGRMGGSVTVVNIGADESWSDAAGAGVFAALAHGVVTASMIGGAGVHAMDNVPINEVDLRSAASRHGRVELGEEAKDDAARPVDPVRANATSRALSTGDAPATQFFPLFLAAAMLALIAESFAAQPSGVRRV